MFNLTDKSVSLAFGLNVSRLLQRNIRTKNPNLGKRLLPMACNRRSDHRLTTAMGLREQHPH